MIGGVIGGNLDEHNPAAVRVLDPHLGQSPGLGALAEHEHRPRPAAHAQRARPAPGARSSPSLPASRAGARTPPAIPSRERTPPRDQPERRSPGRSPSPARRGRNVGFGPGRHGATESGCSRRPRHHLGSLLFPGDEDSRGCQRASGHAGSIQGDVAPLPWALVSATLSTALCRLCECVDWYG